MAKDIRYTGKHLVEEVLRGEKGELVKVRRKPGYINLDEDEEWIEAQRYYLNKEKSGSELNWNKTTQNIKKFAFRPTGSDYWLISGLEITDRALQKVSAPFFAGWIKLPVNFTGKLHNLYVKKEELTALKNSGVIYNWEIAATGILKEKGKAIEWFCSQEKEAETEEINFWPWFSNPNANSIEEGIVKFAGHLTDGEKLYSCWVGGKKNYFEIVSSAAIELPLEKTIAEIKKPVNLPHWINNSVNVITFSLRTKANRIKEAKFDIETRKATKIDSHTSFQEAFQFAWRPFLAGEDMRNGWVGFFSIYTDKARIKREFKAAVFDGLPDCWTGKRLSRNSWKYLKTGVKLTKEPEILFYAEKTWQFSPLKLMGTWAKELWPVAAGEMPSIKSDYPENRKEYQKDNLKPIGILAIKERGLYALWGNPDKIPLGWEKMVSLGEATGAYAFLVPGRRKAWIRPGGIKAFEKVVRQGVERQIKL